MNRPLRISVLPLTSSPTAPPKPASAAPRAAAGTHDDRGALERLPKWAICVPLTIQWIWLSLRHGGASLPSSANPRITAGGLVGEAKSEYWRGMGPVAAASCAAWTLLPPAPNQNNLRSADDRLRTALDAMRTAGLTFPIVVKPDYGLCGFGVRRVDDGPALRDYLSAFPPEQPLVLQAWLPAWGEAGIFYAREPGAERGRIIGLALREFPRVAGDGTRSIAELVALDARAARAFDRSDHDPGIDTGRVPRAEEVVRLSMVGSTRVGGRYLDGRAHVTPALEDAIDRIARDMPDFHFGRFDLRYDSLDGLERGGSFTIMEVNGAGSEAIEAWDPGTPLVRALGIVFAKQRLLFEIAAANRRRGHRPIGLLKLTRLHVAQMRLLDRLPPSN